MIEAKDRLKKSSADSYLDRIIERHTATPREDPDAVNYTFRRTVRDSRRKRIGAENDSRLK